MNICHKILLAAIFLIPALMVESCKKDESAARPIPEHPPGIDSVSQCSRQHSWTLETIRNAAVGNWRLIKMYSWGRPSTQDVVLQIRDNATLNVIKDGALLGEYPYTIDSVQVTIDSNNKYILYGFISDRSNYALGILSICGDYMLISESSTDGPDLYYWRE